MGRSPCCDENGLKKGPWTTEEDDKLVKYIKEHGLGSWRALPKRAGLNRCGKSCRLRWTNYLRPDIKRGNFSQEEKQTILQLHSILGNKWSAIASNIPGRTDNEIKNFWNTYLKKKLIQMGYDPMTHQPRTDYLFSSLPHLLALANLKDLMTGNPLQEQLAKLQSLHHILHSSDASSMNNYNSFGGNNATQDDLMELEANNYLNLVLSPHPVKENPLVLNSTEFDNGSNSVLMSSQQLHHHPILPGNYNHCYSQDPQAVPFHFQTSLNSTITTSQMGHDRNHPVDDQIIPPHITTPSWDHFASHLSPDNNFSLPPPLVEISGDNNIPGNDNQDSSSSNGRGGGPSSWPDQLFLKEISLMHNIA